MRVMFQAVRWFSTEPAEMRAVSTIAEARAFGNDPDARLWGVEVFLLTGKIPAYLTQANEPIDPVSLGAKIRLALAGDSDCPSLEQTCGIVNSFYQERVVSRETLRRKEIELLKS